MTDPLLPHYDVAILGGGLGGLLTANCILQELKSRGCHHRVSMALFEASTSFGGRARSPELVGPPAACVNLGPHALYQHGPLDRQLRELDVALHGASPTNHPLWLDASTQAGHLEPVRLPTSLPQVLGHRSLTLAQKAKLLRAMQVILTHRTLPRGVSTARVWIESLCGKDTFLQALFATLIRLSTYCADLDLLPAETAATQLRRSLEHGVLYLDGGWQTIIDALHGRLPREVQVHTSCKVTHIKPLASGRLRLDFARREQPPCTATHIVAALPPRTLVKLIDAGSETLDELRPVHAACIDLLLRPNPQRTRAAIHGMHEPCYYANHSLSANFIRDTSGIHDSEVEVVHAARYLTGGEEERGGIEALERWLDTIAPCWREDTIMARRLPKIPVIQHLAGDQKVSLLARLPDNLYAVGDWCEPPPHHLADAVASSATRASAHICDALTPMTGTRLAQ